MPRIMFDNHEKEMNELSEFRSQKISKFGSCNENKNRAEKTKRKESQDENHCKEHLDFNIRRNCQHGAKEKGHDSIEPWVAYALISLLGAFAILTPICNYSYPATGSTINMSFTAMDLIKMGNNTVVSIDLSKFWMYLITVISFAISFAASILLRDKIEEMPYIPISAGVLAIAGIIIPFGFRTVVDIIKDNFGICFVIQIVCALVLICINIVSLKRMIDEKSSKRSDKRPF